MAFFWPSSYLIEVTVLCYLNQVLFIRRCIRNGYLACLIGGQSLAEAGIQEVA